MNAPLRTFALLLLVVLGFASAAFAQPAERPWDEPPMQLRAIPPVYPETQKAAGGAAMVVISVSIDEEGNVSGTKVLKSTHADFEAPAIEAATQYKFRPAKKAGKTVAAVIVIAVRFEKPSS